MTKFYNKLRHNAQIVSKFNLDKWYALQVNKTEVRVKNYLLKLGFQPNLKGYHLLSRLMELAIDGTDVLPLKYKGYILLSKEFNIDSSSIEKDIQNAISAAWLRGDIDVLYAEFGETLDENRGKPTNKQFLLTALERINHFERFIPAYYPL